MYGTFRSRPQPFDANELALLQVCCRPACCAGSPPQANRAAWSVHTVLDTLHSLVERSNINQQVARSCSRSHQLTPFKLAAERKGEDVAAAAGPVGSRSLYKMLGYFSLVGLLRLHCLLGAQPQCTNIA